MPPTNIFIGTAAWNIPKEARPEFPAEGSVLQKYAGRLRGVEINSCFYRDHKPETYAKWADAVPDHFQFSLKLSKYFTHDNKLGDPDLRLGEVIDGYKQLGQKLGVILVQLPPSLAFEMERVEFFFLRLRDFFAGNVVVEPRHMSWLEPAARELFERLSLAKVIADPEPVPPSAPGDFQCGNAVYYRFHGSPEMYRSKYTPEKLAWLANELVDSNPGKSQWCIFDNTTFGHATLDALELSRLCASEAEIKYHSHKKQKKGRDRSPSL